MAALYKFFRSRDLIVDLIAVYEAQLPGLRFKRKRDAEQSISHLRQAFIDYDAAHAKEATEDGSEQGTLPARSA